MLFRFLKIVGIDMSTPVLEAVLRNALSWNFIGHVVNPTLIRGGIAFEEGAKLLFPLYGIADWESMPLEEVNLAGAFVDVESMKALREKSSR